MRSLPPAPRLLRTAFEGAHRRAAQKGWLQRSASGASTSDASSTSSSSGSLLPGRASPLDDPSSPLPPPLPGLFPALIACHSAAAPGAKHAEACSHSQQPHAAVAPGRACWQPPLHWAGLMPRARTDYAGAAELLMVAGADVHAVDSFGCSALHYAAGVRALLLLHMQTHLARHARLAQVNAATSRDECLLSELLFMGALDQQLGDMPVAVQALVSARW